MMDNLQAAIAQMNQKCILMFSGGRDSTLAAIRLAAVGRPLILATVTTEHLVLLENVCRRVREIRGLLPADTLWLCVAAAAEPHGFTDHQTCLPCHHTYVAIAAQLADEMGSDTIGFGYTGYQSSWPEQTPYAVERLTMLLARQGLKLLLPVYDIASKEAAIAELSRNGVSPAALEQKCLRRPTTTLPAEQMRDHIDRWQQSLANRLSSRGSTRLDIRSRFLLRDLPIEDI